MKKILYLCICILLLSAPKADAQYYITSQSWVAVTDTLCHDPDLRVNTNAYLPGLSIRTYYSGTSVSTGVLDGGGYGYAQIPGDYASAGTYTTKHVLYNGLLPVDSIIDKHEYLYCNTLPIKAFSDVSGSGIYDSISDPFMNAAYSIEVKYNGVIIDTLIMLGGNYFSSNGSFGITGSVGDVYSFKVVSVPAGTDLTYPATGIIYDTIENINNNYSVKMFGFHCIGTSSFDLAVNALVPVTGVHDQWGNIYVTNASCTPTNATVTMNFSPTYSFVGESSPKATSASGNTITWNLTGLADVNPVDIYYVLRDPAGDLVAGDTVHENIIVTPTSGDADPTNNVEIIIDTVKAGVDPNEMSVSPSGYIFDGATGTPLKYTIGFENTGNDTAFNISVYDTLSDNVDVKSLNLIMASSQMNIAMLNYSGHNIVKFDFPNINLIDSSHHGQCDGAVIFTINAKSDLPDGTKILNEAGIYFDYNGVVMTNTVEDVVCNLCGDAVKNINKTTVQIYPNPATDELTINMGQGAYNTLNVTNTIGQVLLIQQISTPQTTVNVKALPAGIYYITLRGDDGIKTDKFIKL